MSDLALVAGAGGFVGRHLASYLVERGMQVVGFARRPFEVPGCDCVIVDLTTREAVLEAMKTLRPRWVFNLAGSIDHTTSWPDQRLVLEQHWGAVVNLVEAMSSAPPEAFINVGSSDEYGDHPAPQREDMREKPISPYSAAKVAATHYLQMCHRQVGFPASVARFFLVYGPGQDVQRLIPMAFTTLLRGETLPASPGLQVRDFLYIRDAVEGLASIAASPGAVGRVFNVASGKPVSVRTVLETVRASCGRGEIDFGARPMRAGEIMQLYADISNIEEVTGWRPRVELDEGLRRTADFYRARQ